MPSSLQEKFGRRGFLRSAAGVAAGAALSRPATLKALANNRPRLMILLIAEQFRTDYLFRNASAFGLGGFRRLMDQSSFFPDCRLLSTTFTSTGLATLATGSYAQLHGIVANRWWNRASREVISADGAQLEASTIFSEETDPRNRLFVIGPSEPKARLLMPRGPTVAVFRKPDSTFAVRGQNLPWLSAYNLSSSSERQRNKPWLARGAGAGSPPLRVLAYDPARAGNFDRLYLGSPFAQTAEMSLLPELVAREQLGSNSYDTVAVILDSLSALGGEVGAASPLVDDEVIALDNDISSLLDFLSGRGLSYSVVFTAAHGAAVIPPNTGRVAGDEIANAVEDALAVEFGRGKPGVRFVEAYIYPFLYLRTEHVNRIDLARARQVAGRAAMATGKVASFYTADGYCSLPGDWEARLRNSFHRARAGDVLLVYQPGFVEDTGTERGVSFGSPYNYDAQVPLLLWGPPFIPRRFYQTVEMVDIAPTLAAVTGTTLPSSATGRVLAEALGDDIS